MNKKTKRRIKKILYFIPNTISIINLKAHRAKIGKNFLACGIVRVYGNGKITIGNDVTINSSKNSNPIGASTSTVLYAKDRGEIIIGDKVGISNSIMHSRGKIVIEDSALLGNGCQLFDNDFHPLKYEDRTLGKDENIQVKPIIVGAGAFIGAGAIVLKGVHIGEKSVIGAGAVVTKNVPNDQVWAGNPARCIKELI